MNISHKIYFYFLTMCFSSNFTKYSHEEHFYSTETISMNGKDFTHSKKYDNGVSTEQFLINGVPVEPDQYRNELNSVKLVQMNDTEKEIQRKTDDQQNMQASLKGSLLTKLVTQSLADLQENIKILEEPIIKPYLAFHTQTLNSASDLEQLSSWVNQIQKNIKSTSFNQDFLALQKLADEIETKVEKVRNCMKQSIQKATTQCDDTATLKKLLMLIEK